MKKNLFFRNIFASLIVIVLLSSMFLSAPPVSAYSNVYESESNNTLETADVIYDQNYNYGNISSVLDSDWWKFTYGVEAMVNIYLANIPTGCNYDLQIYDSLGTLLATTRNDSNSPEIMRIRVYAGETYYIKIAGTGTSSDYYLLRIKWYALKEAGVFTSTSSGNNYRPAATNSLPYLKSMGYTTGEYLHNNATNGYGYISRADVVAFCGHGNAGWMTFYHADGSRSRIYGNNSSAVAPSKSMSDAEFNGFNETALLLYAGCSTGATSSSYGNLVDITNNKGVLCVVGWTVTTYLTSSNFWMGKFFEECANRYTIEEAMSLADDWVYDEHPSYYDIQRSRHVAGFPEGIIIG